MSPFNRSYFVLFIAFSTGYILTCTFAGPISSISNPYQSFVEYLMESKCSMPSVIKLPFTKTSDVVPPFSYLSEPLKECQTPDALMESDEAKLLCNEIFEVLQNITCVEYKTQLPEIQSEPLSKDVCKDFKIRQIVFPNKTDYLSWRLVDPILCKFLCGPEKYHLLCEILLWSHDLQIKIKSALESAERHIVLNKSGSDEKGTPTLKNNLVTSNETVSNNQENKDKKAVANVKADVQPPEDETTALKGSSNLKSDSNEKTSNVPNTPDEIGPPVDNSQKINNSKGMNETETPAEKIESKTDNINLQAGKSNENLQNSNNNQEQNDVETVLPHENNKASVSPAKLHTETVAVDAGNDFDYLHPEIEDAKHSSTENQQSLAGKEKAKNNPPLPGNGADILTPKITPVDENKSLKSNLESTVEDKQKSKGNATKSNGADVNIKSSEKSDNSVPQDNEMDNELNNVNLEGQENESKVEQPNVKTTDEGKKTEEPKLTDFEPPIGGGSETGPKPTESTTMELLPEKDEDEPQEEKGQDQYNDTENEAELSMSEYDNSFINPPLKNKEVENKMSDLEGSNMISSNYDSFMSSRNNIGRMPDDGPLISSFPQQEDGHFFFYFLSIVLILMAGYLIFHNKQKIIALIVEGRHERRRRSHGSGYKKLETK